MLSQAVSKSNQELLIEHLVKIEEEREAILREFFPKTSVESIEFERFITNYLKTLEDFIRNGEIHSDDTGSIPYVLVGSLVEIMDIYDESVETVQLVSPFLNQGHINYTFASYLSPLGRELLLKKKGHQVKIKTPSGSSCYLIRDIRFPADTSLEGVM